MVRLFSYAVLIATLALSPSPAWAQEENGEVDYLEVATVLTRDGHYQRALQAINKVNMQREGLDKARYFTLQGLIYLNLNQTAQAQRALIQAISQGAQDRRVHLYLAQAYYQQGQYEKTLQVLAQSGGAGSHLPAVYFMTARSYWELERPARALATLTQGSERFVDQSPFIRQRVFYLIELGLYRRAADLGLQYLNRADAGATDYVAIGNALRQSQQFKQALRFLEAARLKFPQNSKVKQVLAHTYLDRGQTFAAAEVMSAAAHDDPELMAEAAELQRRSGNLYQALMLNAAVGDSAKKLKQRLAIFLELKRYEQVAAMGDAFYRTGLLKDEDVRYAYAYALFKTGAFTSATRQLAQIRDSELFRKSVELREAIKACEQEPWLCF